MTTSFINETTVDQELQLTDLQQINGSGGWAVPIMVGLAWGSGYLTKEWWDDNKEDIADAIHDFISEEDDCEGDNSSSYREEPGSRGGGGIGKPVLK